ncbi:hypothetical protein HY090_03100, partial [Candidatus Kaiserbacteria bacterium]|nr:hypothetical protein [Candidatus Kaiserbacteria bacterium]
TRDGRGWLVEKQSLADFATQVRIEEKKRLEALREKRASEYRANREFIPLKEAAAKVGYTPDYLAKLSREGSVNAVRIGREWSVELASLEVFKSQTGEKEAERIATLRQERASEYAVFAPKKSWKLNVLPFDMPLVRLYLRDRSFLRSTLAGLAVFFFVFFVTYAALFSHLPFQNIAGLFSRTSSTTPSGGIQHATTPIPVSTVVNNYVTNNNTYHNTYNEYRNETLAGISAGDLSVALQGLKNSVLSQVYGLVANVDRGVSGNTQSIQLINAPHNNYDVVKITNSTFTGGSISNASADLTSLNVSGDTNLNGNVSVGGTFSVAGITSNGPVTAPYFVATSSSSSSTFASSVGIGTTSPLANLDVYGNAILSGANRYLNFGTATGTAGYGFRDNSGTLEFKNNAGSWTGIGTGSGSGGTDGNWSFFNGSGIRLATSTNQVLIGSSATTTSSSLEVIGSSYISENFALGTTSPFARFSIAGTAGGTTSLFAISTSTASATTTALSIDSNGNLSLFNGTTLTTPKLTLGSLNGPLQANAGVVSATSSIGVLYGGTGLTTAPSYGQLLLGNALNGYTLTATSSLGLASLFTTTYPLQFSANVLSLAFGTSTSNTWGGTQTFTNTPILGSLSGLIGANSGSLYQIATSSAFVTSLRQTYGTTQTGDLVLATTSSSFNGLTIAENITNSTGTFTFQPTLSGTLTVGGGGTSQTSFT